MEESSTFVAIMEQGAIRELRNSILGLGTKRFGAPDQATQAILGGIQDLANLRDLQERLFDVSNWRELLASS